VIGCIVLAAGEGRRFGGVKQLASVHGRPLLQHVTDLAFTPGVVVLGAHADRIRDAIDFGDLQVVEARDWAEGQAASLRAGVAALGDVDAALVLLGDMPFVTPQVVAGAVDHFTEGYDAVRTTYDGRAGHPFVLGRRILDRVGELRGDVGARELLGEARVHEWEAAHLCDPIDIDTPEEVPS
jgi:molybdenum cofactor cytidylyltransferase